MHLSFIGIANINASLDEILFSIIFLQIYDFFLNYLGD